MRDGWWFWNDPSNVGAVEQAHLVVDRGVHFSNAVTVRGYLRSTLMVRQPNQNFWQALETLIDWRPQMSGPPGKKMRQHVFAQVMQAAGWLITQSGSDVFAYTPQPLNKQIGGPAAICFDGQDFTVAVDCQHALALMDNVVRAVRQKYGIPWGCTRLGSWFLDGKDPYEPNDPALHGAGGGTGATGHLAKLTLIPDNEWFHLLPKWNRETDKIPYVADRIRYIEGEWAALFPRYMHGTKVGNGTLRGVPCAYVHGPPGSTVSSLLYDGFDYFEGGNGVRADINMAQWSRMSATAKGVPQKPPPALTPAVAAQPGLVGHVPGKTTTPTAGAGLPTPTAGDPLGRDPNRCYLIAPPPGTAVARIAGSYTLYISQMTSTWADTIKASVVYSNLVASVQRNWDDFLNEMEMQASTSRMNGASRASRLIAVESAGDHLVAAYLRAGANSPGQPGVASGLMNSQTLGFDTVEVGTTTPASYLVYDGIDWYGALDVNAARALCKQYTRLQAIGAAAVQQQQQQQQQQQAAAKPKGRDPNNPQTPVWADLLDAAGNSAEGAPVTAMFRLFDAAKKTGKPAPIVTAREVARILGATDLKESVRVLYTEDGRPFGLVVIPYPKGGLSGVHVVWTPRQGGWLVAEPSGIFQIARGGMPRDPKVSKAPFSGIFGPDQDAYVTADYESKVWKYGWGPTIGFAFHRPVYGKVPLAKLAANHEKLHPRSRPSTVWILRVNPLIGEHYVRADAPGVTVDQPTPTTLAGMRTRRK